MHIIIGLGGLWATLVATHHHMPAGFNGFFHPAALILLLGAPPSILLVGPRPARDLERGGRPRRRRCDTTRAGPRPR